MGNKNISISIGGFKNIKPLYAAIVCDDQKKPKAVIRLNTFARLINGKSEIVNEVRTDKYIKEGDNISIAYQIEQENKQFTGKVVKANTGNFFEIECEGNISNV